MITAAMIGKGCSIVVEMFSSLQEKRMVYSTLAVPKFSQTGCDSSWTCRRLYYEVVQICPAIALVNAPWFSDRFRFSSDRSLAPLVMLSKAGRWRLLLGVDINNPKATSVQVDRRHETCYVDSGWW